MTIDWKIPFVMKFACVSEDAKLFQRVSQLSSVILKLSCLKAAYGVADN